MKLPKSIFITEENRRVYPVSLVVNSLKLTEIVIDPHYELKHPYMSDELIYKFALKLDGRKVIIEDRKKPYEYFTY